MPILYTTKTNKNGKSTKNDSFFFFLVLFAIFLSQAKYAEELAENPSPKQRRLLRVWPSYRPEECEWAIRKFICLRCLKNGHRYAQEIHFLEDGRPYRIHGCFTHEEIFFPIPEGRDHPTKF